MKKISILLLPIILICFTGCEDKKPQGTLSIEDTPRIFVQTDKLQQDEKQGNGTKKNGDTFTLTDMEEKSSKVTAYNQKVFFHENQKPIVLINLFATWCQPCRAEIPYLNDLQEKYQEDLFVVGVLTHDKVDKPALNAFAKQYHANYFISNSIDNDPLSLTIAKMLHLPENFSIPLTVMYLNGIYYTHYEGNVPVEMIEYDIEQAKKQLKSR